MPLTRSAIKKLRQDKKKEQRNSELDRKIKSALSKVKKSGKADALNEAISFVDKGVKKNLFHKNKAARIKSNLMKFLKTNDPRSGKVATPVKKTAKKTTAKKTIRRTAKKA